MNEINVEPHVEPAAGVEIVYEAAGKSSRPFGSYERRDLTPFELAQWLAVIDSIRKNRGVSSLASEAPPADNLVAVS